MESKGPIPMQIEIYEETDRKPVVGTVKLFEDDGHGGIALVPTPTNDPNDPLNLPTWQKWTILIIVDLFAATGNLMASGINAILPGVKAYYNGDLRTNDLATWPAFYMGVGNLLAIPVAHAVGRRPIYLLSTVVLASGCLWCACSKSLTSHIVGRDIMSIAAGQAEALCPIIVQETFFLHQRGRVIAWFCALQTLGTAALIVASSYLAADLGWRWWYGIFGCVNGAIAVFSVIFVKETKYFRTLEAIQGAGIREEDGGELVPMTTLTRRQLDTVNFAPRSFLHDMLPWKGHFDWTEAITCWKQMFALLWFPNIIFLVLVNSAGLGIYVLISALFAGILVQPPFLWGFDILGYVFLGQIATAVAVPFFCGFLSDMTVRFMSRRNHGVSEAGIAVTLNFEYFGFVGIVVSSFVYVVCSEMILRTIHNIDFRQMDSYPQRIDAALVLICSLRGFIGFGISFGTIAFVNKAGYEGAFNICSGIIAALMALGVFVYIFGKKIRPITSKYSQDE